MSAPEVRLSPDGAKSFNVKLNGCDDTTSIEFELTPSELKLVQRIACAVNLAAADTHCMPTLIVYPVGEQEPEPYFEVPDGAS